MNLLEQESQSAQQENISQLSAKVVANIASLKLSKDQKFQRYWNIIRQKLQEMKQPKQVIEKYKQVLKASQQDQHLDRALGAIYGAMVGDALGAYCQFMHSMPNQTVEQALNMNGGGTFGLEAGQFTDDSELASHLLHGLSYFNQNKKLETQHTRLTCVLGLQYLKWMESGPFDIGNTTRCGIGSIYDYQDQMKDFTVQTEEKAQFLTPLFKVIYNRNKNSMANGSLMRISPFAFFFSQTGQNPLQHHQLIKDQIRLTHPNQNLAEAGVCWVSILTQLINRKSDDPEVFKSILESHMKNQQFKDIQSWFQQALLKKEQAMSGTRNMGFAKIAFSYGIRVLRYLGQGWEKRLDQQLYLDWMYWIIKRAGDTDTNGAIAGGLMGSIIGFWNLPVRYVVRSLKTIVDKRQLKIEDEQKQPTNPSKSKYHTPRRPNFYQPCRTFLSALNMVQRCQTYKTKFPPHK